MSPHGRLVLWVGGGSVAPLCHAVQIGKFLMAAGVFVKGQVGGGLQLCNAGVQLCPLGLDAVQLIHDILGVLNQLIVLPVGLLDCRIQLILIILDIFQMADDFIQLADDVIQTASVSYLLYAPSWPSSWVHTPVSK